MRPTTHKRFENWESQDWSAEKKIKQPVQQKQREIIGFRCKECNNLIGNFTGATCRNHPYSSTEIAYESL